MSRARKIKREEEILVMETTVEENTPETADVVSIAGTEEAAPDLAITEGDMRLVEAILFAATAPVSIPQIAERFPQARAGLIPDILDIIRDHYAARGVNLVQRDSKYALRTATDLEGSLRLDRDQPRKFTRAAMETMAVIAYHQPVTRAEIENIRGVATSPGALDALMEAGWIKPGKRREAPGRPVTWVTTQGFLDHFGVEKTGDLPGMDELKAAGLLDKRPAIEAMPTTGDMFEGADNDDLAREITDEDLIGQVTEDSMAKDAPVSVNPPEDVPDDQEESFDETDEDDDDDFDDDDDDDDDDSDEGDDEE